MSENTEGNTSDLLLDKQEISEASLDGVSGGRQRFGGIVKTIGKAVEFVSNVASITAVVGAAKNNNNNNPGY